MLYAKEMRAFTLVEVMVALVIFMVASMGLLPLLISNMQLNLSNRLHAQARRLAGDSMAKLQVVDYDRLALVPAGPLAFAGVEILQQVEQNQPELNQSRLTVTAFWQQHGKSHHYRLQMVRSAP